MNDPTPQVRDESRARGEAAASDLLANPLLVPALALHLMVGEDGEELVGRAVPTVPENTLKAVQTFAQNEALDGVVDPDAHWVVLTEALALLAVTGEPSAARVDAIGKRLRNALPWVVARWDERTAAQISAFDDDRRTAWLDALGTPPNVGPKKSTPLGPVSVTRNEADWDVKDPFQLWDDEPVAATALWAYGPIRILRLIDRQRWFGAIDAWPDARLVHGALFGAELRDSEPLIMDCLRVARPCFDEAGAPTARSAAVALCRVALDHVEQLIRTAAENGTEADAVELARFFAAFLAGLFERSDGRRIGTALLVWLFDCVTFRARPKGPRTEACRIALDSVVEVLSRMRITTAEYREHANARRTLRGQQAPHWHSELPAMLAASRTISSASPAEVGEHRAWLSDVLGLFDQWGPADAFDALVRELVSTIRREADPIAICMETFEVLELDRRRGEFARTHLESNAAVPSLLLLVTLATLIQEAAPFDDREALRFARDGALRIALTDGSTSTTLPPREVLATIMTVACARWGLESSATRELVAAQAHDLEVMGRFLFRLSKAFGRDACEKLASSLGKTLSEWHAAAQEWAIATGRPIDEAVATALSDFLTGASG